jgi:hypothetical protein
MSTPTVTVVLAHHPNGTCCPIWVLSGDDQADRAGEWVKSWEERHAGEKHRMRYEIIGGTALNGDRPHEREAMAALKARIQARK